MYHSSPATLAIVVLAACAPTQPPDLTDAQRTAISDTIRNESAGWKGAAERGDANAVMSYYSDAPGTTLIRSDQSLVSYEALKNSLLSEFRSVRSQTITPREQRIEVVTHDAAAESSVGDWVSTDTAGRVEKQQFAFTRLWARRDGKWRVVHAYLDVRPVAGSLAPATMPR